MYISRANLKFFREESFDTEKLRRVMSKVISCCKKNIELRQLINTLEKLKYRVYDTNIQ